MTRPSPIRFDRSVRTVVILCDECTHWRALRLSMTDARECAAEHERQFHPEHTQHQDARRQRSAYARRHAEHTPEMLPEPHGTR